MRMLGYQSHAGRSVSPSAFRSRAPVSNANVSFSTNFATLDGNPISQGGAFTFRGLTEGTDWTNPQVVLASDGSTHVCCATQVPNNGFDDSIAFLSGYPPNQWASGTVYNDGSITGLPEVELFLRGVGSSHSATGYEVDLLSDGRLIVVRWNGALSDFNLGTTFTTNVSVANGAVWYAQIVGNIITVLCNGSNVCTIDTTTHFGAGAVWTTGSPGLGFYGNTGTPDPNTQANRHFAWKAYSAGSL